MSDEPAEPAGEPEGLPWGSPEWPWSAQPPSGHGTTGDRQWAVAAHLSIFALGIAFPLAVVLWRGHRSPYVCHQAVEALNFQTTVLLAVLLCSGLSTVLSVALLLPLVLAVAGFLAVRAATSSGRGAWHRYPLTLRFVS